MKEIYAFSEHFAAEYINMREMMSPEDKKEARIMFGGDNNDNDEPIYSINGDTATIKIQGPLSRSGPDFIDKYLGYGGTAFGNIINAAKTISENESVNKVFLEMDTPGGEAAGTLEAAESIYDLRKKKNVTAINMNTIASAGYWIASQANKIYASSPLSETGSVGVVWVLRDGGRDLKDDEYGYAQVRIVSKNAKNKRPDITKPAERKWMQDMIDGIERLMIADIAKGRNTTSENIIENFGQGAMFLAKDPDENTPDAVKIGMIDGIKDYKKIESQSDIFSDVNTSTNPAMRDNITEVKNMSLKELLAQNPAANIEYEHELKLKETAGYEKGKADMVAISTKAAVFASSKEYPEQVKAIALEVMQGKKSVESLDSIVATADMIAQMQASAAAQGEQKPATPGQQAESTFSKDGIAKTESDVLALAAHLKGGM